MKDSAQTVPKVQRGMLARMSAWYLRDFPIQRGKGLGNWLIGRFVQVTLPGGATIRLINPLEYTQRVLLYDEPYEVEGTQVLLDVLQPGMTFLDIGANLGYFSLIASKLVGDKGKVYSFEPSPETFQHFELNIRTNSMSNVVPINAAVSEAEGERELFLSDSWNHGVHSFGQLPGSGRKCQVACTTLDAFSQREDLARIDMMKVDVEGAELLVFRGGIQVLSGLRPSVILFELCTENVRRLGHRTSDVKQFLHDNGYRLYRLEPRGRPTPLILDTEEDFSNAMAVHGESGKLYLTRLGCAE